MKEIFKNSENFDITKASNKTQSVFTGTKLTIEALE